MINLFAGLRSQITLLKEKLKKHNPTKNPKVYKEILDALEAAEKRYSAERAKRVEKQKAKENAAKEVEATPKVEDGNVVMPKKEFVDEHEKLVKELEPMVEEHKEQGAELKEVKEAAPALTPKCAICGVSFKSQSEYQQHKEDAHGHRDYQPMDPAVKRDVVKNVEHKLGPAIIGSEEPKAELYKTGLKIDDKVEPVRGAEGSVGIVLREPGVNGDPLVYIKWIDGPMKLKDEMGGYYPSDVRLIEEVKPMEEKVAEGNPPPPDTSIVPPHNPGPEHVCPDCKDWHTKHADLKTNYEALLNDLKEERAIHYESGNYKWVERLDQKIQDMEKAIAEKFPSEKQSAQLEHHDPIGHGMGDLYILPNSPEEAQKIIKFVEDCGRVAIWSTANVEGHKWYGKRFIEVPFGMDIEKEMREYFAGTPLHTRPVEEIMSSKQANFDGKCDMCKGPVCERCNQCHKCVQINGSMKKECGAQNSEQLCVMDHTPPRANTSADEIGKDTHDEFQDEWAMPAGMEIESKISPEERASEAQVGKMVKQVLSQKFGLPLKVRVIPSQRPNTWIDVWSPSAPIPNEFRAEVAKSIGATNVLDWNNVNYGNIRENSVSLQVSQWKKVLETMGLLPAIQPSASLKIASIPVTVFNKNWSATPVTKAGKLGYDISDESGKKVLHLSPLNGKEMNAEHLKWAAEREITKGYKKATLKEDVAFMKKGSKVWVISNDGKKVKFANLEAGIRGYVASSKIQLEALESQAVSHNGHSDKVLGQTGSQALLDCVEAGPIWVDAQELKEMNRPPATPEALAPIEEEASEKGRKPSSLVHKEEVDELKNKELQNEDCSLCHGKGAGPERGSCAECGVYSSDVKTPEDRKALEDSQKKSAKDCPDCHGTFAGKENEKCPTCGRFSVTALKTALPPTIPNQRGYLDNPPPVEKKAISPQNCPDCKAVSSGHPDQHYCEKHQPNGPYSEVIKEADGEVLGAEGLDMYANNTSELYEGKMAIVSFMQDMISKNTYDRRLVLNYWEDWFAHAAKRYLKEFPEDAQPTAQTIKQAAMEIEPFEKEKIINGEYETINPAMEDINKLPVMDVEQEKDKLIDQLRVETDPEKKKSLERRYKHLTMASLNVTAHIKHEDGKWVVYSHDYSKTLGSYPTKAQALKRLRQIEFYKKQGTKVRPFSKKAAETMIDPYQALTEHITDMRSRMEQVQQRLESSPLPKTADAEIIKDENNTPELSVTELFEDLTMGIDLLEIKLKEESDSEELHKNLEDLENLLWETEMKAGITPELSEHEKEEPEHKEIVEEVEKKTEKEAQSSGTVTTTVTSPGAATTPTTTTTPATVPDDKKISCALCGGQMFNSFDAYQQHMQYQHASDTMPTSPSQKNLPTIAASKKEAIDIQVTDETVEEGTGTPPAVPAATTTAPVIQNVQPTDQDNLEVPVAAPTSPAPQGQKWIYNPDVMAYVLMPDPAAMNKTI